jgi:hypothetical protein
MESIVVIFTWGDWDINCNTNGRSKGYFNQIERLRGPCKFGTYVVDWRGKYNFPKIG